MAVRDWIVDPLSPCLFALQRACRATFYSHVTYSGVQISRYIANFGDRDIHLMIDATDSGDCPTDSKYSTCA